MRVIYAASLLLFLFKVSSTIPNLAKYDYIIVGAGSSGATLASRISEDYPISVLLIEAGGVPPKSSEIPLFSGKLWNSHYDWNYTLVEQKNACLGYIGKKCTVSSGKVLGGTSGINQMLYIRGNHHDFNRWAESGTVGWSYNEVLPYFQRAEDIRIPDHIDYAFHGRNGPLTVSEASHITRLQQAYLEGGKQAGLEVVDFNGMKQSGIGKIQTTLRKGARCSTEKAYLRPAYGRSNLHIIVNAHVTKILFDNHKRARQVQFDYEGKSYISEAQREIILSAGAYNTPQILMLSGIGPKKHLESLGIKVLVDLPVGQNLQDHVGSVGTYYTINSTDSLVISRYENQENLNAFLKGLGPLTSPGGVEAVAFFKSKFEETAGDYPDTELIFNSILLHFPRLNEEMRNYLKPYAEKDIFTIISIVLHPKSKGVVKLRSKNPYDMPIIDHQFLSEEEDLKVIVEGMKKGRAIAESDALRRFGAEIIPGPIPGCEKIDMKSDDYLACVAKTVTMSMYHYSGTCKMGEAKDPSTVVDSLMRVKGVKGLRVVDCSIIPIIGSGHTNAAAIMIGEKAADLIRFHNP